MASAASLPLRRGTLARQQRYFAYALLALMAAGVIAMVPMIVLFVLLEPFLVSGMTSGSQH